MKYGVIVADPPWSFGDRLTMSDVKRGSESNYGVLDKRAITTLDVKGVAADNAVLGLWFPASLLSEAYCCMDAWGFEQKQIWVWVKTSVKEPYKSEGGPGENELGVSEDLKMAFGMGRLARGACEYLLVGVRGKVYNDLAVKNIRNVFLAPNAKHSAKPEKVQEALELMFVKYDKLELFARRDRPGWICVGDECPSTEGEDIRDSLKRLSAGKGVQD